MPSSRAPRPRRPQAAPKAFRHDVGEMAANDFDPGSHHPERASNANGEGTAKRKRKKAPASEAAVEDIVGGELLRELDVASTQPKPRKRKKTAGDDEQAVGSVTAVGRSKAGPGASASARKTSKKVDKGKGKEVAPPEQPKHDPNFLSAVIAAAAASAGESSNGQAGDAFDQPQQPQGPYFTPGPYTFTPPVPGMQQQHPTFPVDGPNPFAADPNLSDLQNNEEFVRALHTLDVDKLTEILRSFGQQTVDGQPILPLDGQANGGPNGFPPMHILNQMPALAAHILGQPLRNPPRVPPMQNTGSVTMPLAPPPQNDHLTQLLHTKWLNTTKLNELAKTKGLVYKKGKFSSTEEQQVREALETYRLVCCFKRTSCLLY